MEIESVSRIEELWQAEEARAKKKAHPENFPSLPEIPAGRYFRDDFFDAERKHLWNRTWLFVGLLDDIPEIGSYRSLQINGAPLVIVRNSDASVGCFYNVCQHRGATLVTQEHGKTHRFICRYHCWSYSLNGALSFVPDEHDFPGLDRSAKGLKALRCETWGNLIFISFDQNIMPLADYLGDLQDSLSDVPFDKVRLYRTLRYDVACNWKCVHDAFSETYHVRYVHSGSVNMAIDPAYTARFMYAHGHNGMIVKARANEGSGMINVFDRSSGNANEMSLATTTNAQLSEITRRGQRSYNIFPNMTMPIAENIFPILSLWPISSGQTQVEVRFLKICESSEALDSPADREVVSFFDSVTQEDISALEEMQGSLGSGGITSMPLCYGEQFIFNFHQEIDRIIGRENIAEDLRIENVELPLVSLAA